MCCSHFSWYCFFFLLCSVLPFFPPLIHWFYSLSSFAIQSKWLKNFICAALNDSHGNIKWSSTVSLKWISQHPNELVSSWHSFYNCHKQLYHVTALLISLCVIQTHGAVALTYCDQSVDSCCHSDAHKLHRQANLHHMLGTRLHASLSPFGQQVIHIRFVNVIQLRYVLPFISIRKSLTIHSNWLHYVLREGCMSNIPAIFHFWNQKKHVFSETPKCFKALTMLAPMSYMVATTYSPALWQASRN